VPFEGLVMTLRHHSISVCHWTQDNISELDTRVLTVASPGYLKKRGHPTDPQQIVAERHLMFDFRDPETGRPFEWAFRKGRKEIKVETQSQLMLSDVATMHAVCLAVYAMLVF
jgi:hypothetical protein